MLRPEVAALFELTTGATRFYVTRLHREVDLTRISVQEAEELLALEGGFEWLRRRKRRKKGAGPAVDAAGPAKDEN